jgi:predicted ester cyclase
VVTRATLSATHDRGEYSSLMPTGEKSELTAITIHRIVGGKIAE